MHTTEDPITKSGAYEYNILQYFSKNTFDSPCDCKPDHDMILHFC